MNNEKKNYTKEQLGISNCAYSDVQVAEFSKVPYEQFQKDFLNTFKNAIHNEIIIRKIYEMIELPSRSTAASAGYDIRTPFGFMLNPGENIVIPTGLRCRMDNNYFLNIVPRSGLGFKMRTALANTNGIIDADYYNADNYGHIMIKLTMDGLANSVQVSTLGVTTSDVESLNATLVRHGGNKPDTKIQEKSYTFKMNEKIVQGIFIPYGITVDDSASDTRTGGFGSTGEK